MKIKHLSRLGLVISFFTIQVFCGCSTVKGWIVGPKSSKRENKQEQSPSSQSLTAVSEDSATYSSDPVDELNRKLAEAWTRIDELEASLAKHKQRLALIERGLVLGIIPDELLPNQNSKKTKKPSAEIISEADTKAASSHAANQNTDKLEPANAVAVGDNQKNDTKPQDKDSKELIKEAQRYFELGQYGRSLAIYSQLEDDENLSNKFWMGLCWFKLKEFDSAYDSLSAVTNKTPKSSWYTRAKLHLAQIDIQQGYRDRGLKSLREIVEENQDETSTQIARSTLTGLEKSL